MGFGMKKQKIPKSGAQFAGTPPVLHSEVVLAQQDKEKEMAEQKQKIRETNDDDIEADKHNGSAEAFEATERAWDEEEE